MNVQLDMPSRRFAFVGAALCLMVLSSVPAHASPWVLPKGATVFEVKAGTDFASREFLIDDGREQEFPLDGRFESYRLQLSSRYGAFEGVEFGAKISLQSATYTSDPIILPSEPGSGNVCNGDGATLDGCEQQVTDFTSSEFGFSDLYLNSVIQHIGGNARAASNIEIKIPTGYDAPAATFEGNRPSATAIADDVALGDGIVHLQYRLETGAFIPSTGTVLEFAAGYRARLESPGDQAIAEVKVGQNIGKNLFVFLGSDGAYTLFDGDVIETGDGQDATTFTSNNPSTPAREFDPSEVEQREFRLDYDFLRATAGIIVRLDGREVVLSASTIFWGENIARLSNISVGVVLPFR